MWKNMADKENQKTKMKLQRAVQCVENVEKLQHTKSIWGKLINLIIPEGDDRTVRGGI